MKQTNDVKAFGFGGGKPVANRTLRKFRARRRVQPGFPWDGQFQTEEEIARYFAGDRILCLLCGRSLRRVSVHVQKIHGIDEDAYRVRFGLPLSRGLVSDASLEAYARGSSTPERLAMLAQIWGLRKAVGRKRKTPLVYHDPSSNFTGKEGFKFWNDEAMRAEFLKRIASGRTKREVCGDADMPGGNWLYTQLREHPEFRAALDAVWEALPFAVQARAEGLGERFEAELRALFERGVSDKVAAKILGVTAMACNRRTKPWRALKCTRSDPGL
jgi:ROS/MUCR transcriptional regulator protein